MGKCACGNKTGWTEVQCGDCAEKERQSAIQEIVTELETKFPSLATWVKENDIDPGFITTVVTDELPPNAEFQGFVFGGTARLFLTTQSLLRFEIAVFSGRVKSFETIPLTSISGFETKPPTASFPDIWTFKITSSSNVDEFFISDKEFVRPFIKLCNEAIAASQGQAVSSGTVASSAETVTNKLKAIAQLHADGILTDEEYSSKKAELLKDL